MSDHVTTGGELPRTEPGEPLMRLLGHVDDRRVLVLGVGLGHAVTTLAAQGARVIGVDPSAQALDEVRARCDEAEVRAELHQADLAELPFLRADTIDAALSAMALAGVGDLDRVFRQAHRVLRSESPLVISLPHPAAAISAGHSYFDRRPRGWSADPSPAAEPSAIEHPRTVGDVFTSLHRANFRVDVLDEIAERPGAAAPATLVVRAKKEGV